VIGGQGDPYLHGGDFLLSYAYRYQRSDRHFRGDSQERERHKEGSEEINEIHLMDFGVMYAAIDRLSFSLGLPLLIAERSEPIQASDGHIAGRNITETSGIGDVSTVARLWLLEPAAHPTENISLGLGAKFPTGEDDARDDFLSADGTVTRRAVDQSIQPGDGGYGAILELQAFTVLLEDLTLYGQGTYLFNPRNTNGVETGRSRESESEMSVADQYVARLGVALPLFPEQGLSLALGGRVEGVPVRDLIGDSDGFRRPGYAVSVEPSIIFTSGPHTFSVAVPFAVYRNRQKSVPDQRDNTHGDAAFADYLILVNYSFRFDRNSPKEESASSES
jgi:hypothetical protein